MSESTFKPPFLRGYEKQTSGRRNKRKGAESQREPEGVDKEDWQSIARKTGLESSLMKLKDLLTNGAVDSKDEMYGDLISLSQLDEDDFLGDKRKRKKLVRSDKTIGPTFFPFLKP